MAEYDDMENAIVARNSDNGDKKKKKKKSGSDDSMSSDTDVTNADDTADNELSDNGADGSGDADGTDDDSDNASNDKSGGKKKNGIKDVAKKASAAASGAQAAYKAAMLAKFLAWLKMMLQMLQQMIAAVVHAVVGLVQTIVTAVVNFVVTAVAAVGVSTVVTVFGAIGLAVVVAVVAVVSAVQSTEVTRKDDAIVSCAEDVNRAVEDVAIGDTNAFTLEMAQNVYSFYSTYGADDVHIAGILGNWSHESGIDPTGIEGIYDEPFRVTGHRKRSALLDLNHYTYNILFPLYEANDVSINRFAFQASDGKYYCGLGLGQWTGPRALGLLQTAESSQLEWYTIDAQLIYSVSTDSRAPMLNSWFQTEEASPEDAAATFMHQWEGISTDNVYARQDAAAGWYVTMAEWEVNADYANSLIELANVARLDASADGVRSQLDDCRSAQTYNNSSIAHAAVSYAYPNAEDGAHDNGTQLYQTVHDAIFPGDTYYASCDRGASTAIRWSGSDDTFPIGNCSIQFDYCFASTKWEHVLWNNDVSKLQPGDVLICDDCHTFLYVGNEIIKEIHGDDMADNLAFVEAGYGRTAPVCIPLFDSYVDGSTHNYYAFRCVSPDNSTTYANAADGYESHENVPFDAAQYPEH